MGPRSSAHTATSCREPLLTRQVAAQVGPRNHQSRQSGPHLADRHRQAGRRIAGPCGGRCNLAPTYTPRLILNAQQQDFSRGQRDPSHLDRPGRRQPHDNRGDGTQAQRRSAEKHPGEPNGPQGNFDFNRCSYANWASLRSQHGLCARPGRNPKLHQSDKATKRPRSCGMGNGPPLITSRSVR